MAKQIRLKDGKVLKVEYNNECLCRRMGYCGAIKTKSLYCEAPGDFPVNCPLEEYQEVPATVKESLKVEPAAPKEQVTTKEDICTMLCPDCHTLIHIGFRSVIAEKDAEITQLKNACEAKDHQLQDRWNRIQSDERTIAEFAKENNRLFQKANDLEKVLQYKCQMREAAEPPKDKPVIIGQKPSPLENTIFNLLKGYGVTQAVQLGDVMFDLRPNATRKITEQPPKDEPELVICDCAEERCKSSCNAWKPHQKSDQCTSRPCDIHPLSKCIPYKKPTAVPQSPPACFGNCSGKKFNDESCIECRFLAECKDAFYGVDTELLPLEEKTDLAHLNARMMELEQHQGRDRADLMAEIRALIKSVGELEVRLDNAEAAIDRIQRGEPATKQ